VFQLRNVDEAREEMARRRESLERTARASFGERPRRRSMLRLVAALFGLFD
jgi:hypothetical protein